MARAHRIGMFFKLIVECFLNFVLLESADIRELRTLEFSCVSFFLVVVSGIRPTSLIIRVSCGSVFQKLILCHCGTKLAVSLSHDTGTIGLIFIFMY